MLSLGEGSGESLVPLPSFGGFRKCHSVKETVTLKAEGTGMTHKFNVVIPFRNHTEDRQHHTQQLYALRFRRQLAELY